MKESVTLLLFLVATFFLGQAVYKSWDQPNDEKSAIYNPDNMENSLNPMKSKKKKKERKNRDWISGILGNIKEKSHRLDLNPNCRLEDYANHKKIVFLIQDCTNEVNLREASV